MCVSFLGGPEVPSACPAAVVESDTDSEQSRAGAADTERAVPGQSLRCFYWYIDLTVHILYIQNKLLQTCSQVNILYKIRFFVIQILLN